MNDVPSSTEPPPVDKTAMRVRAWLLIGAGVALVPLLLWLLIELDRPTGESSAAIQDRPPITELINPRALTEADIAAAGERSDVVRSSTATAESGWIQIVDKQSGRLAQRYRFERLDPNPPGRTEGWLQMDQPQAEIHLSGDRVLTISGNQAEAHAPNRALEQGEVSGAVVMEVFEGRPGAPADPTTDDPTLRLLTEKAWFDSVLGEVRCPERVRIESPTAEAIGHGVVVHFNDQDNRIQMLKLDRLEEVRLDLADTGPLSGAELDAAPKQTEPGTPVPTQRGPTGPPVKSAPTGTSPRPPAGDFYLLTLHDNVVVQQGTADAGRRVTADALSIVFGGDRGDPTQPRRAAPPTAVAKSRASPLKTGRAPPEATTDDRAIITCDGPVTMVPLEDLALRPDDPRDTHVILTGEQVQIEDTGLQATVMSRRLLYRTLSRTVELQGDQARPMVIAAAGLAVEGQHMVVDMLEQRARLSGTGWMRSTVDQDDPSQSEQPSVQIRWTEQLDLRFVNEPDPKRTPNDRGAPSWRLQAADFRGDVWTVTDDLELEGDSVSVQFAKAGPRDTMESITAEGDVEVASLFEPQRLTCDHLRLWLDQTETGKTTPRRLVADGAVEVEEAEFRVWSEQVEVGFAAAAQTPGTTVAETVTATDGVQVLTANGARLFGQRLTVDPATERAELTGTDVLIVHETAMIDGGHSLTLDGSGQMARWEGPGRFRSYAEPVGGDRPVHRIPRPTGDDANGVPELTVTWSASMVFDQTANNGAGVVDLYGDVDALTRQNPREQGTMQGDQLTLNLVNEVPGVAGAGSSRLTGASERSAGVLGKLVARGGAKLEQRIWANSERSGTPKVFYVAGEQVEYDDQNVVADVLGDGTLLIRDPKPIEPGAGEGRSDQRPFSGRGITMFQFQDRLHLEQIPGNSYQISMSGDVRGSHKAPDGRTASLTGQRVEAVVTNLDRDPAESAGSVSAGIRLGGSIEMKRIRVLDEVYIRTPERRVQCDELDYDVLRGVAFLRADPGRTISVITTGTGPGFTADATSIRWDLIADTITIDQPSISDRR